MSATVVERPGRKRNPWAVVVTQVEPQRVCEACGRKVWTTEHRGDACPACPGALGPARDVRRQRWHGYPTKKEARDARSRLDTAVQDQVYVGPSRVTLGAFLDEWAEATRPTRRPTTEAAYRTNIRVHIRPALGSVLLRDIDPSRLNRFYAALLGKGLAPKTVGNISRILHRALADAVRWHRIVRNPAADADPPKASASKDADMQTWSASELGAFLAWAEAKAHPDYAAYVVAGTCGLRRGEVLGLPRGDGVDLDAPALTVRQNLVLVEGVPTLQNPKTSHGRRTVSLDPQTAAVLRAHLKAQAERRLALGAAYADHGLVFQGRDGRPMRPDVFSQRFDRGVKAWRATVEAAQRPGDDPDDMPPRVTFHDLRHTHVRHLIEKGVHPQRIRDRLGHASAAFTMDRYGRFMRGQDQDAAAAVAAAIFGPGGPR